MTQLPDETIEYLCEEFDYLTPTYCDRCGCLWEREDVPVCPVCNADVLAAMDAEIEQWLERESRGDVLRFDFSEPGKMTVWEEST